jgi:hypothetical protein
MAFTYNRLNYGDGQSGGDQGNTGAVYVDSFVAADWSLSGSVYTYTVLNADHGKGTAPGVQVYEEIGSDIFQVDTEVKINSSGDVEVRISSSTDLRFNGKVVILE